ncbi:hypothetical protein AAMO2058_000145300 [Amorphochlora amoebiformis]
MDEDLGCPKCMSKLANVLDLVLRYSNCCGNVLCTQCVNRLFSKDKIVKCDGGGCGEMIGRGNFVALTFEQQLYKKGVDSRDKSKAIFNQKREDFDTLEAYNDYLELVADITYLLAYGSEKEKKDATARMKKYQQENSQKITARKLADEDNQGNLPSDRPMDISWAQGGMGGGAAARVYHEPVVKKLDVPAGNFRVDSRLAKLSGGFKFEYDEKRNQQEARAGLYFRMH